MRIRIAELTVLLHNRYPELRDYCKGYLAGGEGQEDLEISVSPEELRREMQKSPLLLPQGAEIVCAYRKIGFRLPDFEAMIMHAAVLDLEGCGIALLADSGTGKTTLALHFLKEYGSKVRIINGDKPIVRFLNGRLMAFGTPWNGKERYGRNDCVELKKLCFLQRAERNRLRAAAPEEMLLLLMQQLLIPESERENILFFALVERLLDVTEGFIMECTDDQGAAAVAAEGMGLC